MKSLTKFLNKGSTVQTYCLETKLGSVILAWNPQGLLKSIRWDRKNSFQNDLILHPYWKNWIESLRDYFDLGRPLGEVPWDKVDQSGWTLFQKQAYRAISEIPHGETRSYSWVAGRMGNQSACRAVGQALRKNPVLVLIPCHRVITAQGGFGGFMGKLDPTEPELVLKRKIIELEQSFVNPLFPFVESFFSKIEESESATAPLPGVASVTDIEESEFKGESA